MNAGLTVSSSDVSRETIDRLKIYEALILNWNPAINLVSKSTLNDLWNRHFLDSLDVYRVAANPGGLWLDMGSGGGFPGAVVAIVAADNEILADVICVEADIRKCEFLRTVSRSTGVPFKVMSRRVEDTPTQNADVISARALTALPKLLEHAHRHMSPEGIAIFPKGESWKEEVEAARRMWHFDLEAVPSSTNPNSAILRIGNIQRV